MNAAFLAFPRLLRTYFGIFTNIMCLCCIYATLKSLLI